MNVCILRAEICREFYFVWIFEIYDCAQKKNLKYRCTLSFAEFSYLFQRRGASGCTCAESIISVPWFIFDLIIMTGSGLLTCEFWPRIDSNALPCERRVCVFMSLDSWTTKWITNLGLGLKTVNNPDDVQRSRQQHLQVVGTLDWESTKLNFRTSFSVEALVKTSKPQQKQRLNTSKVNSCLQANYG